MTVLMRRDPFLKDVDQLFETFFGDSEGRLSRPFVPAMDLVETDGEYLARADLPGMTADDVTLEVNGDRLTISGERKADHEAGERGWYRFERSFGRFNRVLTLPDGIDTDAIQASFENGVLELRIPKPAKATPRRIQIGGSGQPAIEGTASEKNGR